MTVNLGKTNSGIYQCLSCDEKSDAFIRSLSMYGFGDVVSFFRINGKHKDGTPSCFFGSDWGIYNLKGPFPELDNFQRLLEMPSDQLEKLTVRMYKLLFPTGDVKSKNSIQINEELKELQYAQKSLVKSGEIKFPGISQHEIESITLW